MSWLFITSIVILLKASPVSAYFRPTNQAPHNGVYHGHICFNLTEYRPTCGWAVILSSSYKLSDVEVWAFDKERIDDYTYTLASIDNNKNLENHQESNCLNIQVKGSFGDTRPDVSSSWYCVCTPETSGKCKKIYDSVLPNTTSTGPVTEEGIHATNRSCIDEEETHVMILPEGVCNKRPDSCKHEVVQLSNTRRILCDTRTEGGGWLVIQRRPDNTDDFTRSDFSNYTYGFGDIHSSFWFGLENIHRLCPSRKNACRLRIDMMVEGQEVYASYDYFTVAGGSDHYRVEVEGFYGISRNIMANSNKQLFTAEGTHGPQDAIKCIPRNGGWWFDAKNCSKTPSLNRALPKNEQFYTEMKVKQLKRKDENEKHTAHRMTLTFEVNVTDADLDKTTQEYAKLKQSVEKQVTETLEGKIPGLAYVRVTGMRKGSLVVDMEIGLNSELNPDPEQSLAAGMRAVASAVYEIKKQRIKAAVANLLDFAADQTCGQASIFLQTLADILRMMTSMLPSDAATMMKELENGMPNITMSIDSLFGDIFETILQIPTTVITSFLQGEGDSDPYSMVNPVMLEALGNQITTLITKPNEFVELLPKMIDSFIKMVPDLEGVLMYVNIALDMMQLPMDAMTGTLIQDLMKQPNTRTLVSLIVQAPEMIRTMMYNVVTDPVNTIMQALGLESFEKLCAPSATKFMSVPQGSQFNMDTFMSQLCSMNPEILIQELSYNQGARSLMSLFQNGTQTPVNSSVISIKLLHVIESFSQMSNETESLSINPLSQMLNASTWEGVFNQIPLWMNQTMEKLSDMSELSGYVNMIVGVLMEEAPELSGYVDIIIDTVQMAINQMSGSSFAELRKYPTVNKVLDIVVLSPEIAQTLVYTILTQPVETVESLIALEFSLSKFCNTSDDKVFTVPRGLDFNMASVKYELCTLNTNMLLYELYLYQGQSRLMLLFGNETVPPVPSFVIQAKAYKLIASFATYLTNPTASLPYDPIDRLFNFTTWEPVLGLTFALSSQIIAHRPDELVDTVVDLLRLLAPDVAILFLPVYDQVISIVNLMMDTIIRTLDSNTFEDVFHEFKTVGSLAELLNELPEVLETLIHTISDNPMKMFMLSQITSFQSFCTIKPELFLTLPKNSTWDVENWMRRLCATDVTGLMYEVENSTITHYVNRILDGDAYPGERNEAYMGLNNITLIIGNMEQLLMKLQMNFTLSERIFDPSLWNKVFMQLFVLEQTLSSPVYYIQNSNIVFQSMSGLINSSSFDEIGGLVSMVSKQLMTLDMQNPEYIFNSLFELFNLTVSGDLGGLMAALSDENMPISPEMIEDVSVGLLRLIAPDVANMISPIYDQGMSITNLVLGNILEALDDATFNEVFKDFPSLQSLAELINELPEVLETVLHTVGHEPMKFYKLFEVSSFQTFCTIKPVDLFALPPNSTWNYESWMGRVCSLDVDRLMYEVQNNTFMYKIDLILDGDAFMENNMTQVFCKMENLIYKLTKGFALSERIFDPSLWQKVVVQLDDLQNTIFSPLYFLQNPQLAFTVMSQVFNTTSLDDVMGLFTSTMNMNPSLAFIGDVLYDLVRGFFPKEAAMKMPMHKQAAAVINTILDQVTEALDNGVGLEDMLKDSKSIKIFTDLLKQLPELIETLVYTLRQEPQKFQMNMSKMTSFESLCSLKPDVLFTSPPTSSWDPDKWFKQLCSLNLTTLMDEIQIQDIILEIENNVNKNMSKGRPQKGNDTDPYSITDAMEKMDIILTRLTNGSELFDGVFDSAPWTKVTQQFDDWQSDIMRYIDPEVFMCSISSMDGDSLGYIDYMLDLLTKLLTLFKGDMRSNLKDFKALPAVMDILRESPSMVETVIYTVLKDPNQVSKLIELESFGSLCKTPATDMLSVPNGASFDITAYITKLCKLDPEVLIGELWYIFADLINGTDSSKVTKGSLEAKYEQLMKLSMSIMTNPDTIDISDIANSTMWNQLAQRVGAWLMEI